MYRNIYSCVISSLGHDIVEKAELVGVAKNLNKSIPLVFFQVYLASFFDKLLLEYLD